MYRSYVMICGGPNCTLLAGRQEKLAEEFEVQLKLAGLRKEVQVMRGGCLGLCSSGPNVAVFPEGTIYSHVHVEDVAEIVSEHLLKGGRVDRLLYNENEATSTVRSLEETEFYKKQLRIAETQKYAHVTYFFNGGVEAVNEGEDRVLIPSSKVATFDMKPEMSAYEITDKAIELINEKKYDVMILNFANCDMVGHTGVMEAAMKAVAAVDECVDRVVKAVLDNGGRAFVTADHGNADQMVDPETGEPFTAHTTNPVPFIAIGPEMVGKKLREGGRLADIAPTMLDSMGIPVPAEMTGKSLIVK